VNRCSILRLLIAFGLLTPAGCTAAEGPPAPVGEKTVGAYEEIDIVGEDLKNGIFDPSLEYDGRGTLWMAYSRVEVPQNVDTHLAKSTDGGKTWHYVAMLNRSTKDSIRTPEGKTVQGVWRHETATLLRDPGDRTKPWKLFWHKYFAPDDSAHSRMFQYGWIAYREAADPAGPWSEETPLFGAGPFPPSPFKTTVDLAKLHPDLSDCKVLAEPGSLAKDGIIYLSLQAYHRSLFTSNWTIILVSSSDHGKTWRYVATLIRAPQAKPFGGEYFTGSSLAEDAGRDFFLICPEQEKGGKELHRGTVVFEFADLAKGKLKGDDRGNPLPVKKLLPQLASGGQSDYDEHNTYGGIVMPQFDRANLPRPWRIYSTRTRIVEPARRNTEIAPKN
jgi:hypothetical protein